MKIITILSVFSCVAYGAQPNFVDQAIALATSPDSIALGTFFAKNPTISPNVQDQQKKSPLREAICADLPNNVKVLLSVNADPCQNCFISQGITGNALQLAL